jgi:hypothetical protein
MQVLSSTSSGLSLNKEKFRAQNESQSMVIFQTNLCLLSLVCCHAFLSVVVTDSSVVVGSCWTSVVAAPAGDTAVQQGKGS